MSANTSESGASASQQTVPTVDTETPPGIPKKIANAQTVCNEKNAKGKLCNGHLKQLRTGGEDAEKHLRGDDVLFKCQSCGTLYMGPPLGHVRDPDKQSRFVEKELMAILQAAGGTMPTIVKNEKGVFVLAEDTAHHAPAAAKPAAAPAATPKPAAPVAAAPSAAPQPATVATPSAPPPTAAPSPAAHTSANVPAGYVPPPAPGPVPGETHEQKLERLRAIVAEAKRRKAAAEAGEAQDVAHTAPAAASTSGMDSSAQADMHRPAAEAQAATGMASAVPLSEAAATASPVAGPETEADLAPDAVVPAETHAAPTTSAAIDDLLPALNARPVEGETQEQKIARLKATVAAAKERARREGRGKE